MIALIYLAIATCVGYLLCKNMLPALDGSRQPTEHRAVSTWVIAVPAGFLCGTLLMTWATYIVAWFLRDLSSPLAAADTVVISGTLAVIVIVAVRRRRKNKKTQSRKNEPGSSGILVRRPALDIAVAAVGLSVGAAIMFHTCRIEGNTLVLGRTAFGDLNIHLGMARSFSYGKNFPTGYVAYAGTDIRYHFMFYFLVGNLEFLGLRLDWALNLPSILSFASVLLLLYALGATIGRDPRVGLVGVLFFLLRSSPAAFSYFAHLDRSGVIPWLKSAFATKGFIGLTGHESWGIWNLNVYVVERHFAFAFGLVLLALLYLIRTAGLDTGPSMFRSVRDGARTPESSRG
jgi:hypothetical protein